MSIENKLEHIKKPMYIGMMVTLYFLYIGIYFGLTFADPLYVTMLSKLIRLFVCMFLIIRFHPFKETHTLREFDEKIIFASAILLLTDLGITQFVLNNVRKRVTWSNTIQEII